jgi:hypothetical protein
MCKRHSKTILKRDLIAPRTSAGVGQLLFGTSLQLLDVSDTLSKSYVTKNKCAYISHFWVEDYSILCSTSFTCRGLDLEKRKFVGGLSLEKGSFLDLEIKVLSPDTVKLE